jgi:hypothetical protein
MAHLSDGTLRRMVDDPDSGPATDARHLEGCPDCAARLATMGDEAHAIAALLAVPDAKVDLAAAFDQVRSARAARPRFVLRLPVLGPVSRPVMVGLAAALAAVALLATAIAQDGTLFAPNKVTAVPVTVADMQALSQLSNYGTVSWTSQPQLQVVASAAAAQSASGLVPPVAGNLPSGVSTNITYAAMTKAVAVFTFSAAQAQAAAAASGKSLPALPAGMDGAQLTVDVGPAVGEIFGNLNLNGASASDLTQANLPQLVIVESSAPTATSTQVSVKELETYLLSMPGISPDLAAAIKAIGNPGTTLPIPIPVQYATATSVQVQGVDGVALGDNTGLGSGVVWVKHGLVYAVAGTVKQSDAVTIADNLR